MASVDLWVVLAWGMNYASVISVGSVFLWFVFINFFGDEDSQPLDYYSNKLRARPYLVVFMLLIFLGIGLVCGITDRLELMRQLLPELLIAAYLQGYAIFGSILVLESSAAALVAALAYSFVSAATAVITVIPTLPARRPGVFYSGMFFVLNVIWVLWAGLAIRRIQQANRRHALDLATDDDEELQKRDLLVPAGAERLPYIWAQVVCKWSPVMMIVTSMVYGCDYLLEEDKYGPACALAYYIVAFLLVLGCCHGFRFGTELE